MASANPFEEAMTKAQFDWAWEQAPDAAIAELFCMPDAPIVIGNPLDRKWLYGGTVDRSHIHREYRIPCRCRPMHALFQSASSIVPNDYKSHSIVICPGGTLHVNGKHTIYYVGVCDDCNTVYWLTEE